MHLEIFLLLVTVMEIIKGFKSRSSLKLEVAISTKPAAREMRMFYGAKALQLDIFLSSTYHLPVLLSMISSVSGVFLW